MKWIAVMKKLTCAKLPLTDLLQDRLDEATTAKVVAHLDQCEHCQRRITELSANADWWRDAAVCLENAGLDGSDGEDGFFDEFDEPHGPTAEEALTQCGLMTKSSKPEMIGSIGRYEIRRVIGTGGTGIVLQAVDCELDRIVALKVLSPTLASNGAARRRFSREGQAAASVAHDNVVAIYHVESAGPVPYLVMQYVDGCSLQEWVMRSGPIDTTSALRMIAQLAAALEAAHEQGLVHRDVKPANILVSAAGQRVWITDFGLARAVDDASLTRTGFIAGTPHYMSPEQARGETVSARSDLFGLGSVLYFALTGRPPFRADRSLAILNRICNEKHRSVREVNPDVSSAAASMVDRLLQKDPHSRFQTAEEVRQECLRLLTQPEETLTETVVAPTRTKRPRRLKRVTSLAVAMLAVGTIAVFAQGRARQSESRLTVVSPPIPPVAVTSRQKVPPAAVTLRQNAAGRSNSTKDPSPKLFDRMHANGHFGAEQLPGLAARVENANSPAPLATEPTLTANQPSSQPAVARPFVSLPHQADSWDQEFEQLEQEMESTSQQLQEGNSISAPSIDWTNEIFDQGLNELDSLLQELENPHGGIHSEPVNQLNYGTSRS